MGNTSCYNAPLTDLDQHIDKFHMTQKRKDKSHQR